MFDGLNRPRAGSGTSHREEKMVSYKDIERCRIGGADDLITVLDLGEQDLTGVFPTTTDEQVTVGPLQLVWSPSSGLLQLGHSYEPTEMYGDNYGYRSGLNQSMVDHLRRKVGRLEAMADLRAGDSILDIGSNDATLLKAYKNEGLERLGIDPTGKKFKSYYPDDVGLVADFFSAQNYWSATGKKAKIVTSVAMFYDLEDPLAFVKDVAAVLADDGLWHFEQSYMPTMLRKNSYDTVCHEHIEYYSLTVIHNLLRQAGLKIVDFELNTINGGSIAITAAHDHNKIATNQVLVDWQLEQERRWELDTPAPYFAFADRVKHHREDLVRLIRGLTSQGYRVLGYGASTKGNVLLQYCGLTSEDLLAIVEVNEEKFGRFTPGTHIPIVSEAEAEALKPDFYLMLPWHFRDGILKREPNMRNAGVKFIMPFPVIQIV